MNSLSLRLKPGLFRPLKATKGHEIHTTAILERARRMTREKKRKQAMRNKREKELRIAKMEIPPFEQYLRDKGLWKEPKPIREVDKDKSFPVDNVYFADKHAYRRYTLEEAIGLVCHQLFP